MKTNPLHKEVIIYVKQRCPYCVAAKELLADKGVQWREIDIEDSPALRDEMIRLSGGRRTVPQIFVDGQSLGGYDDTAALEHQGLLDQILGLKKKEMDAHTIENVIILGSGPAGLTAAIYAARANLNPLVVAGNEPGGQLTTTTEVENFPGYIDGVQGPEMMEQFRKQAERFGTRFKHGNVDKVDLSQRPFALRLENGETLHAKTLIVSTGASAKYLGLPSEQKYRNKGVSACATCDGFFFRGKPIAVVGGGDTAAEEAIYLTNFAESVHLIHRRNELRASKIMAERVQNHPKIVKVWDSVVEEVLGDDQKGVTGVRVKNVKSGQVSDLKVDGLFIAIGHQPNTAVFDGQLETDEQGYLVVKPHSTYTSVEGVFACGDVADKHYRQAITAAGTGCMAAIDAERWLSAQG